MGINRRAFLAAAPLAWSAAACSDPPVEPAPLPGTTAGTTATSTTTESSAPPIDPGLASVEAAHGVRLGVYAANAVTGRSVAHRADERFPFLSTIKTYLAAAVLAEPGAAGGAGGAALLARCEAAVVRSDNDAANQLIERIGGPAAVTGFARSIGDQVTRSDRWEPELNTAVPGDGRDTTSPRAMAGGYRAILLGQVLPESERDRLWGWMVATATGRKRIRSALPPGWAAGDKTGTGRYGSMNDVAVTRNGRGEPIVIAVFTTRSAQGAEGVEPVFADVTREVLAGLGEAG